MREDPIEVRAAGAEEVIDLRHRVLRAGLARETAVFPGDEADGARHFVATRNGRIVGCVTLHPARFNGQPAWQLRGMAVEPGLQGCGVGRMLLETAERAIAAGEPAVTLWCNARVPAAGFYQRHGWTIISEVFEVPTAGPHVKMRKDLGIERSGE